MNNTIKIFFYSTLSLLLVVYLAVAYGSGGFYPLLGLNSEHSYIFPIRFPRVLLAATVGSVLSLTGAALQGLLRNPMVSPYTIGVSSGASLGAVLAIRFGAENWFGGSFGLVPVAISGGIFAIILLFVLAESGLGWSATNILLAGITLSFFCSSAVMFIQYTSTYVESFKMVRWLMGGLDFVTYKDLIFVSTTLILGILGLIPLGRSLNYLSLGKETAFTSGIDHKKLTLRIFFFSSLIVAISVSVVGPIAFTGLVVPHILRISGNYDYRKLLPLSMIAGAIFMILADLISRIVLAPRQIPVGIVTSLIGGPYFLFLLLKESHRRFE